MTYNNDPDDQYGFDSLTAQASQGTGDDAARPWYYPPSGGLHNLAAQAGNPPQGNNATAAGSADGTGTMVKGEDLQFGDAPPQDGASSQGGGGAAGPGADIRALRDSYNAQKQAVAQFGQNQPLTPGTTSGNGSPPDFMAKEPPPSQQGVPGNGSGNGGSAGNNPPPQGPGPFAPRPFTLGTTVDTGQIPDFMVKQPLQLQQNAANNNDGNVSYAWGASRRKNSNYNNGNDTSPAVATPNPSQQRGAAINNAANLPIDQQVGRNSPGHYRGFQDGDLMITHYGYPRDNYFDTNSNILHKGNHENPLNENSLSISQNIAHRYGLRIGDPVYVNGQYIGNYDDTPKDPDTIDAYDPQNQKPQNWGGALRAGHYTVSNHP